jgi:hypothetical protein
MAGKDSKDSNSTKLVNHPATEAHTQIQPKVRRVNRAPSPLARWDRATLQTSDDPLAQALLALAEKGFVGALFLVTTPNTSQGQVSFKSSATLAPGSKTDLWTGLNWNPNLTPEVWTGIQQQGFVELSPPGTNTLQTSSRNVLRAAFGIEPSEWLYLARVGSPTSIRGVLALVTEKSFVLELKGALPLLNTPLPATSALPK